MYFSSIKEIYLNSYDSKLTRLNFCDPVKRCLLMIKIYIHRKIVLPVCFGIIRMLIFYYQLQKFRISLCTNSVVIYREKILLACVLSQLYTKTREKAFFNFILKQHWIPIAVCWSLNDSVITHTITIRSNVQHLRWSDVMTL